jgi:hypothetical protein
MMFDCPLPIPQHTQYEELGIAPEAAPDEVREAKTTTVARLEEQKTAAERALNEAYARVPELNDTYNIIERLRRSPENDAPDRLPSAQKKLAKLEQEAIRITPGFKELKKRIAELDSDIRRINRASFDDPEARAAYDKAHPPLSLLKLAGCTRDKFTDNNVALHLARRELSRFLSDRGEKVFHPSDLTREDFSSDFTPNELLDGVDDGRFNPRRTRHARGKRGKPGA